MIRYFIEISFKGTNYHGWQLQPNALSVQAVLEAALRTLLHGEIKTTGAGRTDTGVHAKYFVAHFETENQLTGNPGDFIYKINALLPQDIAVQNIYAVKADAHARYSAISRTYRYTISKVKDPFGAEFSWCYSVPVDLDIMNKAAAQLSEFTDFTSFSKLHSDVKNNNCTIFCAEWMVHNNQLEFTIGANRFLRNMVRSIVGTMIDLGRGKLKPDDFTAIVNGRNRNLAGFSAPAKGLTLIHVEYPPDIKL